MKKTWYRLTLDVAYEGDILGIDSKPVTDAVQAKEVLMRVVKHDIDVALRLTPAGPVDWDLVNVEHRTQGADAPIDSGKKSATGSYPCGKCHGQHFTGECPMAKPLTPPDLKRCQAEKPNGATFMSLGGVPKLVRCTNKPKMIATETKPGPDGQIGKMTLCGDCFKVFQKQVPAGTATFDLIEE